jgi:hypothetical protein
MPGPRDGRPSTYLPSLNLLLQCRSDGARWRRGGMTMTEVMTQDRAAKRDRVRMVADDIVTANSLA